MMDDPIVAEVRRARDEYARKFNYDLWAIYEDLKRREKGADRPVVNRSPKIQPTTNPPSRSNPDAGKA
jgi:hypothetical protein